MKRTIKLIEISKEKIRNIKRATKRTLSFE